MQRLSKQVEKIENALLRKTGTKMAKLLRELKGKWPLLLIGWYFLGLLINSVSRGISNTFSASPELRQSLWEWNPILNFAAIFTPTGLGVIFFLTIMVILITKKGYNWFSGYKFSRDPRGFDILPDGTHGTSGWMNRSEVDSLMETGKASQLKGTILGKIKEDIDDADTLAQYVCPKADNRLNGHVLVIGASGSGKSRGFSKPFIMQTIDRKESLVILDPKGELFETTSEYARSKGAVVRAFNLLDMENCDGCNFISALESDPTLVQSTAEVIIKNIGNANESKDFWEKAESNLLMALLHYILDMRDSSGRLLPIEQRSLGTIYELLSQKSFKEIEQIFEDLERNSPNHPALAPYGIFKLANRQIWGNIAIGLGNRLGVFQNNLVSTITRHNDIDLELPGRQPCVYYCIISDQDSSLEFLSSMFFSLLYARLSNYARRHGKNGALPVKVNMLMDEFCNCGELVDFTRVINTSRSKNVDYQIIVQGISPLIDRYGQEKAEEIIGAADTQLFLGCNDQSTADYLSKKAGYLTIRTTTASFPMQPLFSPIYNSTRPASEGRQNAKRELMMPDELLRYDNAKSIVFLRGQKPLELYKIAPEELPQFEKLRPVHVTDYTPAWRTGENKEQPVSAERAPCPDIGSSIQAEQQSSAKAPVEEKREPKTPDISSAEKRMEETLTGKLPYNRFDYETISPDEV